MAEAVLIYTLAGVAVLLLLLGVYALLGVWQRLNRILERVFGYPDRQLPARGEYRQRR